MRIAVIHGNDGSDVRVGKLCRSFGRLGQEVHFIGWDRRPSAAKMIDLGATRRHVVRRETAHGKATLGGHLAFSLHAFRSVVRLRPDVAWCVNEDTSFLLLPTRVGFCRALVCDVFDALSDRHSSKPPWVRVLLRAVSGSVRAWADRLVATDQNRFERFGRHRRKTVIIENVPEDPGEPLASTFPAGPVKLYVAGSLMESRGLRQVLRAAERVPELEIVSAGWAYDDFAEREFLRHPRVRFHGVVTAEESLRLAASCDAVFSFYAPTNANNVNASPNKIYDAMSVGRPVLINSEVKVARWVEDKGLGWSCPYEDDAGLSGLVGSLPAFRSELPAFARKARSEFCSGYRWDVMEQRLAHVLVDLAGRRGFCSALLQGPDAARG